MIRETSETVYERRSGAFVFRAANGEFYAVNENGEQSPSFTTRGAAVSYLGSHDVPATPPAPVPSY